MKLVFDQESKHYAGGKHFAVRIRFIIPEELQPHVQMALHSQKLY